MPSRLRPRHIASFIAISVLTAACTRSLDVGGLESQLRDQVEQSFDAKGITVDCPDDVKVEAGSSFTCEASDSTGATMVLTVTQTDDRGDVTWKVTGASN